MRVDTPLLGVGQPGEHPRGDRGRAAVRRPARSDRRVGRGAAAGAPPRRAAAPARRHHAHRRLLQLQPGRADARARHDARRDRQRPEGRRARRDAGARRARDQAARGVRRRGGGGGARPARGRRRCRRRARWPTPRVRAGMPSTAVLHVGSSADAVDRGAAADSSRRSRARQGLARHRHRRHRRAAEGGVRLMLYHLLYPLHTRARGLQRDAVHHVPHRGGEPDRARHRACSSGR